MEDAGSIIAFWLRLDASLRRRRGGGGTTVVIVIIVVIGALTHGTLLHQ